MRGYLTLAARNASLCKASTMGMRFHPKFLRQSYQETRDGSMKFHIHDSSRNRSALQVMLNGRRNRTRSWWSSLISIQYCSRNRA